MIPHLPGDGNAPAADRHFQLPRARQQEEVACHLCYIASHPSIATRVLDLKFGQRRLRPLLRQVAGCRLLGATLNRSGYGPGCETKLAPWQIYDFAKTSMVQTGPARPVVEKPSHLPFLQFPGEQYLPFLERPNDVTALLMSQPTTWLMT